MLQFVLGPLEELRLWNLLSTPRPLQEMLEAQLNTKTGQLEKTEQEQGKLQVPAHPMTTPTPARKLYATELPDESAIRGQFMISPFEGIFHLANENIARKLPRKGSPSNASHRCHSHG